MDLLPVRQEQTPLEQQLRGYRLATAEITYHLPDHPLLLQTLLWQHYDLAPRFPELHKFLEFWEREIEGKLHSVRIARRQLLGPVQHTHATGMWLLH